MLPKIDRYGDPLEQLKLLGVKILQQGNAK